jgi:predicted nuclease of predicted toxin-antitoxin system
MRFLVDESTGNAVTTFLRGLGHDVVDVSETMPQTDDEDILTTAVSESRVVVTNDKDFGELVFRSGQKHAGIILLRLRDESRANRVAVVRSVLEQCAGQILDHFIVATETHIRVRPTS